MLGSLSSLIQVINMGNSVELILHILQTVLTIYTRKYMQALNFHWLRDIKGQYE